MKSKHIHIALPAVFILMVTLSCYWIPRVRPALKFVPDNLPQATVGVAYSADIYITQNETPVGGAGISAGTLPAGLTFEKVQSEDIVRISGTPQDAGSFSFTISVWCYGTNISGQMGEKTYTLVVGK